MTVRNLYHLLQTLYTDVPSAIQNVLYDSCYASDNAFGPDTCAMHTGFHFESHTGKPFELIYSISDNKLIRQPYLKNGLPGILGAFYIKGDRGFFNSALTVFYTEIEISPAEIDFKSCKYSKKYSSEEVWKESWEHDRFRLFENDEGGNLNYEVFYPLKKICKYRLEINFLM